MNDIIGAEWMKLKYSICRVTEHKGDVIIVVMSAAQ